MTSDLITHTNALLKTIKLTFWVAIFYRDQKSFILNSGFLSDCIETNKYFRISY